MSIGSVKSVGSSSINPIHNNADTSRKGEELFSPKFGVNSSIMPIVYDKKELAKCLEDFLNDVIKFNDTIRDQSVIPSDLTERTKEFNEPQLATVGYGLSETITKLKQDILPGLAYTAGPRSFPWVVGGVTPAAFMVALYQILYDQINMVSGASIGPKLESETIKLLLDLFNLPRKNFEGIFTTGATASNICGLAAARQWWGEQHGVNIATEGMKGLPCCEIYSGSPHSSIGKALSVLGMGRRSLNIVPTLNDREAVDITSLEKCLSQSKAKAKIVVASAGTVNTGDFDDLVKIKELCIKYNAWLHVDAAFGLFASCSNEYCALVKGIEFADSITVDGHKWLNVPYDCGMLFIQEEHKKHLTFTFSSIADYMSKAADEPFNKGIENSRGLRALPAWASLKAYGRDGYKQLVERNCNFAKEVAAMIDKMPGYELITPVRLNIVLFKATSINTPLDNQILLDKINATGKIFITSTSYNNAPAIRIAVSNWQTDSKLDLHAVYTALTEGLQTYNIRSAL